MANVRRLAVQAWVSELGAPIWNGQLWVLLRTSLYVALLDCGSVFLECSVARTLLNSGIFLPTPSKEFQTCRVYSKEKSAVIFALGQRRFPSTEHSPWLNLNVLHGRLDDAAGCAWSRSSAQNKINKKMFKSTKSSIHQCSTLNFTLARNRCSLLVNIVNRNLQTLFIFSRAILKVWCSD